MASITNASSPAPSLQFSTLLGSTIETIVHELLYSRSIYPPDSFILHRHLGVRCHASRVPQVGDYIASFLRVAIPSIITGVGDSLSLVILEEEVINRSSGDDGRDVGERTGGTKTVERFAFQFQMDGVIGSLEEQKRNYDHNMDIEDLRKRDTELTVEARSQLERSMRECLLRVLALRRRRRRKDEKAENMSFKLCLHVADDKKPADNADNGEARNTDSCPELMRALKQGEWLQPEESSCLFSTSNGGDQQNSKGLLRPIKDINLPSCGMKMQMGMEVDPF
ncbi:hypothetical protein ACHAXR_009494 [Thalassiosira sp. AJA248-18]